MTKDELKRRVGILEKNNYEYGKHFDVVQHGDDYELRDLTTQNNNPASSNANTATTEEGYTGHLGHDILQSFKNAAKDPTTYAFLLDAPVAAAIKGSSFLFNIGRTLARAGAVGTASGAGEAIKNNITGDNSKDPLTTGVISGALAGALPIVGGALAGATKKGIGVVRKLARMPEPEQSKVASLLQNATTNNQILKTPGQEAGTFRGLELDDLASKGKLGQKNQRNMLALQDAQEQSITNKLNNLAGGEVNEHSINNFINSVRNKFNDLMEASQNNVNAKYEAVKPILGAKIGSRQKRILVNYLEPVLEQAKTKGAYLEKASGAMDYTLDNIMKSNNLDDLENTRRMLNEGFKGLKPAEKRALTGFKNNYDGLVEELYNQHPDLYNGDYNKVLEARAAHKEHINTFEAPEGHVENLVKALKSPNATTEDISNMLFRNDEKGIERINYLKDLMGENSSELQGLKPAFASDALSKISNSGNNIDFKNSPKNLYKYFNTDIANQIYGEKGAKAFNNLADELASLKQAPKEDITLDKSYITDLAKDIATHKSITNPISWVASPVVKVGDKVEFTNNLQNLLNNASSKEISPLKTTLKYLGSSTAKGITNSVINNNIQQ